MHRSNAVNSNAQSNELNVGAGYLPAMALLRFARGMATPEGGYPEPASDEEAMAQAGMEGAVIMVANSAKRAAVGWMGDRG